MSAKRERSNAKADIWDIEITSKDFIRFIQTIKKSKTVFSSITTDLDQHEDVKKEASSIGVGYKSKRRNALADIWSMSEE